MTPRFLPRVLRLAAMALLLAAALGPTPASAIGPVNFKVFVDMPDNPYVVASLVLSDNSITYCLKFKSDQPNLGVGHEGDLFWLQMDSNGNYVFFPYPQTGSNADSSGSDGSSPDSTQIRLGTAQAGTPRCP
jgi:hypothetical protein